MDFAAALCDTLLHEMSSNPPDSYQRKLNSSAAETFNLFQVRRGGLKDGVGRRPRRCTCIPTTVLLSEGWVGGRAKNAYSVLIG